MRNHQEGKKGKEGGGDGEGGREREREREREGRGRWLPPGKRMGNSDAVMLYIGTSPSQRSISVPSMNSTRDSLHPTEIQTTNQLMLMLR